MALVWHANRWHVVPPAKVAYGEAWTWKRRKKAESSVPITSCTIEPCASTISPTSTKRRSISTSSHQKNCGSYSR